MLIQDTFQTGSQFGSQEAVVLANCLDQSECFADLLGRFIDSFDDLIVPLFND